MVAACICKLKKLAHHNKKRKIQRKDKAACMGVKNEQLVHLTKKKTGKRRVSSIVSKIAS